MKRTLQKRSFWGIGLLTTAVLLLTAIGMAASGPIAEPDAEIIYNFSGEQPGSTYGWVGAKLGDINGDGVNDFATSAPFYSVDGSATEGKIYVYSGADGSLLHSDTGSGTEFLGFSISSAGDVNNDGHPDYIAGGPVGSHAIVYSGIDHTVLLDLFGVGGDGFGASVAGAGDVNGDGYGDLIVGATADNGATGRVYVLSGADGSEIWSQPGGGPGYRLGSAVGLIGDVNGDGVPDQVAGSDGLASGGAFTGEAYVFSGVDGAIIYTLRPKDPSQSVTFGQFFASGAGDMNADGVPDIYVGDYAGHNGAGAYYVFSGADGRLLRVTVGQPGMGLGPGRGVEDLDGDGYDDVVVGAYTYSTRTASSAGRVFAISGRTGKTLEVLTGTVPNDWFGGDALAIGDVNGDGRSDYLITAYGLSFNGADVGHAYVVAGE